MQQGHGLLEVRPRNRELQELRLRVLALSKDGVTIEELLRSGQDQAPPEPAPKPRRTARPKLNDEPLNGSDVHNIASLGPVLPCACKRPLLRNGVHGASQDTATIDKWMKRWPGCNVGLATGDVVVIDIDGAQGERSLRQLQELPCTLEVRTGRGRHLYFQCDQQIGNSVGKLGVGIDVRGHGGYVIAPPSVHPDTGEQYRFVDKSVPIAALPAWVAARLA